MDFISHIKMDFISHIKMFLFNYFVCLGFILLRNYLFCHII